MPSFIHISFVNVMTHLRSILFLALSALSLCGIAKGKPENQLTLFVGTYTQDSPSKGIYVYRFNQDTGNFSLRSSVKAGNPSFVTLSPNGSSFAKRHDTAEHISKRNPVKPINNLFISVQFISLRETLSQPAQ